MKKNSPNKAHNPIVCQKTKLGQQVNHSEIEVNINWMPILIPEFILKHIITEFGKSNVRSYI